MLSRLYLYRAQRAAIMPQVEVAVDHHSPCKNSINCGGINHWRRALRFRGIPGMVAGLGLYGDSCREHDAAASPYRLDEGLIEERMSRKPVAKPWDRYFVVLVGVFTAAELIVPDLDHRWMWTPPQPVWKHLFGLTIVILGTISLIWAMKANRFFSAFIRIQQDRGHQVVDTEMCVTLDMRSGACGHLEFLFCSNRIGRLL
jgi:hypothetical protein